MADANYTNFFYNVMWLLLTACVLVTQHENELGLSLLSAYV